MLKPLAFDISPKCCQTGFIYFTGIGHLCIFALWQVAVAERIGLPSGCCGDAREFENGFGLYVKDPRGH